jgi:hypothetical protein
MKEFLTARDIEDLVARGVRQIPMGEDIVLTDLARDRAAQLGVTFVQGGTMAPARPSSDPRTSSPETSSTRRTWPAVLPLEPKPKGCLHHHVETGGAVQESTHSAGLGIGLTSGPVVDQLVEAIRRLSK